MPAPLLRKMAGLTLGLWVSCMPRLLGSAMDTAAPVPEPVVAQEGPGSGFTTFDSVVQACVNPELRKPVALRSAALSATMRDFAQCGAPKQVLSAGGSCRYPRPSRWSFTNNIHYYMHLGNHDCLSSSLGEGCSAFSFVAALLKNFAGCLHKRLLDKSSTSGISMPFHPTLRSMKQNSHGKHDGAELLLIKAAQAASKYGKLWAEKLVKHLYGEKMASGAGEKLQQALRDCATEAGLDVVHPSEDASQMPTDVRAVGAERLKCLPLMWAEPGFHGYIVDEILSEEKEGLARYPTARCIMPLMCGRLAAGIAQSWQARAYASMASGEKWTTLGGRAIRNYCMDPPTTSGGQCYDFPKCWKRTVKIVCSRLPECCLGRSDEQISACPRENIDPEAFVEEVEGRSVFSPGKMWRKTAALLRQGNILDAAGGHSDPCTPCMSTGDAAATEAAVKARKSATDMLKLVQGPSAPENFVMDRGKF